MHSRQLPDWHDTVSDNIRLYRLLGCRQLFGGDGGQARVLDELMGYSDYKLHDFALQNGLTKFQLPDDAVLASGKCGLLVELLADLQASTAFTSLLQFCRAVLEAGFDQA